MTNLISNLYSRDGLEIRQDENGGPGVISGPAVRYNDTALITREMGERIQAGAFGDLQGDYIANYMHMREAPLARTGSGLEFRDSPQELFVEIVLPPTQMGLDTAALVKRGVLKGLSLEFYPIEQRWDGDILVRTRAQLAGVAVVDIPAYPKSKPEIRYRLRWL